MTTAEQRLVWIGVYVALSAAGFAYMLWRYNWRYRLSTLLKIMAFWCIVFAAGSALRLDSEILKASAIGGIGILTFVYTIIWMNRPKGQEDERNTEMEDH